jgi:oligosaccharide repeat unit polymerase
MNLAVTALIIDLTVFTGCAFFLFKLGRLSAMHPATTYLFFHLWVVTKRLAELALGSPLSTAFPHQPITISEMTRASLMFDVVLVAMTVAWVINSTLDFKRNGPLPAFGQEKPPTLSKAYFVGAAQLMIPIGIYGLMKGQSTGMGDWDKSFVNTMTQGWLVLCLMLFFYWYGPRKWLIASILAIDVICITIMGQQRWLILLPTIFYCFAYLSRTGRKWPTRNTLLILAVAGIIWLPGKQVADVIAGGGNLADIGQTITGSWTNSSTKSNQADTVFLDMAAMTVGLVDQKGQFYYGNTIFPALYNAVPRALWPDKPVSGQWEIDISTKDRPMATYGMTASIMGAAYADFGYFGIVIIPFFFALFLGWAYFRAFRCSHYSPERFFYLVMACTLFQPYRDGVYSFFIFNFIYLMPFAIITALHFIFPVRPVRRSRYPAPVRLSPAQSDGPARTTRVNL